MEAAECEVSVRTAPLGDKAEDDDGDAGKVTAGSVW